IREDPPEELPVFRAELVGLLFGKPLGEASVSADVTDDVAPASLHEVLSQPPSLPGPLLAGEVVRQLLEGGVEKAQEGAEGLLLAGVWRGGDEDEVAMGVGSEPGDEPVSLVAAPATVGVGAAMRLIHDHEPWAGTQELVPPAFRLDEVCGDDEIGIAVEDRLPHAEPPFQPGGSAGEDGFGLDVELLGELGLPLVG